MGIVLNPTFKFTSNNNLELKIQTNSLVDLSGKALSSAISKTIPITKAENVVINIDENSTITHSDEPRLFIGSDSNDYINATSNGSVIVGNSGNDSLQHRQYETFA